LKYAIVAGALVESGLPVIANTSNPAEVGNSQDAKVLRGEGISSFWLFLGAPLPTTAAIGCFWWLHRMVEQWKANQTFHPARFTASGVHEAPG
jgi:hypothetical protein